MRVLGGGGGSRENSMSTFQRLRGPGRGAENTVFR